MESIRQCLLVKITKSNAAMDASSFHQQSADFFGRFDQRLREFEEKFEKKIEDQNVKILEIIKTNVEHGVFIQGASKMYWLVVAAAISMIATGVVTLLQFVIKH